MVAHATRYQRPLLRTSAIVATMYTTADSADSEYASGAWSNLEAICTNDRPVAASASSPYTAISRRPTPVTLRFCGPSTTFSAALCGPVMA
ncbi:hypothetical protein [Cryobacterium breve]|uniref:hypothetical protein n=1 Tax=Cryobacterium breve TaxID=1259258 RepID=UPI0032B2CEC8